MKKIIAIVLFGLALQSSAYAEGVGLGSDMWTRIFEQWGLFHPHENYCDSSTEAFISISGSASQGFCIEKNERSAAKWETARDTCATNKKRLPEPGEFKFACYNGTGLSNMTDDWEWGSNFWHLMFDSTNIVGSISTAILGSGACGRGAYGYISANGSGPEESYVYRCVR